MRKMVYGMVALALAAAPARAHFVWLLPSADGQPSVRMVFSDALEPDSEELLKKIGHTEVFAVSGAGKLAPVKFKQVEAALVAKLPGQKRQVVVAVCPYGVVQRGSSEPFLLNYYAKTWLGAPDKETLKALKTASKKLPLDIVPDEDFKFMKVLWQGKPLSGAEVVLTVPGQRKRVPLKTNGDGSFALTKPVKPGLYGIRVRHVVKEAGEHKGKKYKEVRHYATLTFNAPADRKAASGERPVAAKAERKEDQQATKLLADARTARAEWENFPGFSADVEVNIDGQITRGSVEVDAKGKVALSGIANQRLEMQTRRHLASIVAHRTSNAEERKTPCAFADDNADHPLGRAVQVLNDEFHSSYRIRDKQIIIVNRKMRDSRFTITVMENTTNEEGKFLPRSYVVNTWDLKNDALKKSETFRQDWKRVSRYDLPLSVLVVTADSEGKLHSRKLTLSGHKLK